MTEYTPTTEEVRHQFVAAEWLSNGVPLATYEVFDRWLQSVKAEAWERGVDETCASYAIVRTRGYVENPYK